MELQDMFYITEENWYKLQAWAKLAYDKDKNEISGLMTAIPQEDGRFELKDVEILKQENTGTNTDIEGQSVTDYKMKYAMKYKDKNMKYVWWHSHHTMGAFWSGTDENEIDAWENESFSLALVVNLKEEYKFRVSLWKANGLPIKEHYDTELTIEREQPKVIITKDMEKQYEELCSDKKFTAAWSRNTHTNYNPRQGTIFNTITNTSNENYLIIEHGYSELIQTLDELIDGITDGSIKTKQFKKAVKEINKNLKKADMPFNVPDISTKKETLVDILMTKLPCDLVNWTDDKYKNRIEGYNNQIYGGFGYGY